MLVIPGSLTVGYIQDISENTGYIREYRIYRRIQDISENTEYIGEYRIYRRIQDISENTGYIG